MPWLVLPLLLSYLWRYVLTWASVWGALPARPSVRTAVSTRGAPGPMSSWLVCLYITDDWPPVAGAGAALLSALLPWIGNCSSALNVSVHFTEICVKHQCNDADTRCNTAGSSDINTSIYYITSPEVLAGPTLNSPFPVPFEDWYIFVQWWMMNVFPSSPSLLSTLYIS